MRIAVFSDVHGNAVALEAVIKDARAAGVEEFWIVGDLVASGPQPAESLRLLRSLPRLRAIRGNTDRYVLTGDLHGMIPPIDQPSTPAEVDALVSASAALAWTRGCITASGHYDWLADLPIEQRFDLPDRTRVLLVHASPGRDDGPGLQPGAADRDLDAAGWSDCDADLVFVGHTHMVLERTIGRVRAINVGSISLPREPRDATWALLDADEHRYRLQRRTTSYDHDAVLAALRAAHHPTSDWIERKLFP